MTKSVRQHGIVKVANSGSLSPLSFILSFISSLQKGPQMPGQFKYKHSMPILHSSLVAQQHYPASVSDQWQSVAGHRIILFRYHHSLTLGHTLVLLWSWKGLPSGGWWWACWGLDDIPWQFSRCPYEQKIQRYAGVYLLFHWRKTCVFPLLLFRQSSSSHFTVQECSICTCPFNVLVPWVSPQLLVSLCSMCQ